MDGSFSGTIVRAFDAAIQSAPALGDGGDSNPNRTPTRNATVSSRI